MTECIYLREPHLLRCEARIVRVVDHAVEVDRTVFHPQGGGQPGDVGKLGGREVSGTRRVGEHVVHHVDEPIGLLPGDVVLLEVDAERRRAHAALHTAGHLIAGLVEGRRPGVRAVAGHHFPGEARVEFAGEVPPELAGLEEALRADLAAALAAGPAVTVLLAPDVERTVVIGALPGVSCGGTHLASLAGLRVELRGLKVRKGLLRIGYEAVLAS